jgi:hypothetical protein
MASNTNLAFIDAFKNTSTNKLYCILFHVFVFFVEYVLLEITDVKQMELIIELKICTILTLMFFIYIILEPPSSSVVGFDNFLLWSVFEIIIKTLVCCLFFSSSHAHLGSFIYLTYLLSYSITVVALLFPVVVFVLLFTVFIQENICLSSPTTTSSPSVCEKDVV